MSEQKRFCFAHLWIGLGENKLQSHHIIKPGLRGKELQAKFLKLKRCFILLLLRMFYFFLGTLKVTTESISHSGSFIFLECIDCVLHLLSMFLQCQL